MDVARWPSSASVKLTECRGGKAEAVIQPFMRLRLRKLSRTFCYSWRLESFKHYSFYLLREIFHVHTEGSFPSHFPGYGFFPYPSSCTSFCMAFAMSRDIPI